MRTGRPGLRELLTGWRDRTWPHRLLADRDWAGPAGVVAVAGVRTRAGATTLAVLLAATYAGSGPGRVVVTDAAGLGGLGTLLLAGPGAGPALLPGADSWPLLAPYLERTAEGPWTVTAGEGPAGPDLLATQLGLAALSPHFAVAVLDCGWLADPRARFLLGVAHARLLAAPATVEGVLAAAAALDQLEPALVALVGDPAGREDSAGRLLVARGGEVHRLPYEPALDRGGPASPAELSAGLRDAVAGLAARLLRPGRPA